MFFTNQRANRKIPNAGSQMTMRFITPPEITFSAKYRDPHLNVVPPSLKQQINSGDQTQKPKSKPMKWGEPTWFLFHTIAEKIRPEYFTLLRKDLFDMIHQICSNLPCPICATHAKQYLASTNFATIQSKDHLRFFFHKFHNEVNQRKGFAIFPLDELSAKYEKANTVNMIHNFITYFEDKSPHSHRMISDNLYRQRIVSVIKLWFNKNIQYFLP